MPTATPEPANIAIPRLEQKLKANPNDRQAMSALASEFLQIGHPEAALPITQHLLQLGEKTPQVYYLDGTAQESLGNVPAATTDLENASDLDPTNIGVLAQLADLYIRENRMQDAERIANRAVTFNKTVPQAYTTLGSVYASEEKWDQARQEFEHAYALNPKDVSPLIQEAQTWVSQKTLPNALAVINRAITADPTNVQILVFRGDIYAKQHNLAQAASAYADAMAAASTDAQKAGVEVHEAQTYAAANQQAQAQSTFQTAIRQFPAITGIRTAFGEYWLALHQPQRAQQQFTDALRVDKSDVSALLDMARLKMSQNRISDAIGYLKQLTAVAPSAQSYGMLGQAYVENHDFKNAKDACGRSFQMQRTPDTLGCIAGSDFSLKNYKEAAQIFDVLDKDVAAYMNANPQLLYMAATSYTQTNQKGKAVGAYKRLLKDMKPGTKQYKTIQTQMASLAKSKRRAPARKKIKHASKP